MLCPDRYPPTAAAWLIELGLDVLWDWSVCIAPISHAGPPAKPMRQPVIENDFDTPLTVSTRSLSRGSTWASVWNSPVKLMCS